MSNTISFQINPYLRVDAGFKDFLQSNNCKINQLILSFETIKDVNFIAVSDKVDSVSYLPMGKYDPEIDSFSEKASRVNIKIGRLVNKIIPKKYRDQYITPADIEIFVNRFKSFFDVSNNIIEVVSGEDIRKYYNYKSYQYPEIGSLWKSCMRQKERQRFLDMYTSNTCVKMLVLFHNENGEKLVKGRALLWEAEDLSGKKFKIMDRIYTIYDSDVFVFKKWAYENGYITKFYQSSKAQSIFEIDGKEVYINLRVKLENSQFNYYPYLDTFQFFDYDRGLLYNSESKSYNYQLIYSDGRLEDEEEIDEQYDEEEVD